MTPAWRAQTRRPDETLMACASADVGRPDLSRAPSSRDRGPASGSSLERLTAQAQEHIRSKLELDFPQAEIRRDHRSRRCKHVRKGERITDFFPKVTTPAASG